MEKEVCDLSSTDEVQSYSYSRGTIKIPVVDLKGFSAEEEEVRAANVPDEPS